MNRDDCKSCYVSPAGCRCRREYVRMLKTYLAVAAIGLGLLFALGCGGDDKLPQRVSDIEADLYGYDLGGMSLSIGNALSAANKTDSHATLIQQLQLEVVDLKKQVQCDQSMLLSSIQAVRRQLLEHKAACAKPVAETLPAPKGERSQLVLPKPHCAKCVPSSAWRQCR